MIIVKIKNNSKTIHIKHSCTGDLQLSANLQVQTHPKQGPSLMPMAIHCIALQILSNSNTAHLPLTGQTDLQPIHRRGKILD